MQKFLIHLLIKKYEPSLVVVWGNFGRLSAREMIASALHPDFDVVSCSAQHFEHTFWKHCGGLAGLLLPRKKSKKIIAVVDCDLPAGQSGPQQDAYHFLKKELGLVAIVVTSSGDIPGFTDLFSGEESSVARFRKEIAAIRQGPALVLNYDDEAVRSLGDKSHLRQAAYGINENAQFYAGEIKPHIEFDEKQDVLEAGMYAKLHREGSLIPFHIPRAFGKQHIYAALAAFAVADCFGMNAVEAIEGMQHYKAPEGKGNIRMGMKESIVVDASTGASPFLVREILDTVQLLREAAENEFRVQVVLGDLLGFGQGDDERQLHKTLGEYIGKVAQEAYLVGERVVFTEEILSQELSAEHIHRYADVGPAAETLERNLKKGDMVLIFGTPGVNVKNVVEKIHYRT